MTQEEALAILKLGVNVFLTGEPGAGKTHTINSYIEWLRERGVDPAVTASTGIAATHVNGMTLHSWSGIGVKKHITNWDIEMLQSKEKTVLRIMDAKVLIIDEISMLDADTLNSVDKVLRALRRRPMMEEQPFGGLQVVFVGDFFQLPPVSRDGPAKFAFESRAWKEANPVVCYLAEQHRQDDPAFLDLLGAIRRAEVEDEHYELLKSRAHLDPSRDATRLHTHNAEADRINDEKLGELDGKSRVFEMQTKGARTLVDALRENCLSPERLTLKEGAKVIFTRNNFEEGYVNGTLGTVVGFGSSGYPIVQIRGGRKIEPQLGEWSIVDGSKVLAQIKQIPLRLAWAITVHKSQGMSLDAAVIDLSRAFEYGQGYVALSRVRSLEGLFLEGFNDRALLLHPSIVKEDRTFRAKSDAAQRRISSIHIDEKEDMEHKFKQAIGAEEVKPRAKAKLVGADTPFSKLRDKYPNVGKPWTKEDDLLLSAMFNEKKKSADIAKQFGRKPSAIQSRLAHLGLIPEYWKGKSEKKK